jgi:capsular polysaccharide biosynthesis protein/Mrp family chromosome partitioning ATPase
MTVRNGMDGDEADRRSALEGSAEWVDEAPPSEGLRLYVDVLRGRLPLLILAMTIGLVTTYALVSNAEKVYEAEAGLLVTPVPRTNTALFGLGLVSESGDPTRDAETLAQLITTPAVAERVKRELGVADSPGELLRAVDALPVAGSSIVAITAEANDPEHAARLANAFGAAAIAVRTDRMHAELDRVIPRLEAQLDEIAAGEITARQGLGDQIRTLEALRFQSDPTLHLETRAAPPGSAVAPRPLLSIAAALIGGLILGAALILAAHVLDRRVEREQDLRRYRIPVVGRVPRERFWRRLRRRDPLTPADLSPRAADAYLQLASQLLFSMRDDATLFITSPGAGDGKTTTSINLSAALAQLGEDVVLADADSRRPTLGRLLAAPPAYGLRDVAAGRASAGDAVMTATALSGVEVLAQQADGANGGMARPLGPKAAETLVREVKGRAHWLVLDGPALAYAPETLALAMQAAVFIVVRLRATRARDLAVLADLLVRQGITPAGFVVIGADPRPIY